MLRRYIFAPMLDNETKQKLAKVLDKAEELDANVSLSRSGYGVGEWAIGIVFGEEAEDSPMAGGASYGAGDDLSSCLDGPMKDFKLTLDNETN